jgi:hypothetical protein
MDAEELRPLDSEGNLDPGVLGSHRGSHAHLNIRNPDPGRVYWYENVSTSGFGRIQSKETEGWEVDEVTEDQRMPIRDLRYAQAGFDSSHLVGDVVRMSMPIERYRRYKARKEEARARAATDPGIDFEQGEEAISLQERYGGGSPDRHIRFRSRGHGYQHR